MADSDEEGLSGCKRADVILEDSLSKEAVRDRKVLPSVVSPFRHLSPGENLPGSILLSVNASVRIQADLKM